MGWKMYIRLDVMLKDEMVSVMLKDGMTDVIQRMRQWM
jgi:hypothetical protein